MQSGLRLLRIQPQVHWLLEPAMTRFLILGWHLDRGQDQIRSHLHPHFPQDPLLYRNKSLPWNKSLPEIPILLLHQKRRSFPVRRCLRSQIDGPMRPPHH